MSTRISALRQELECLQVPQAFRLLAVAKGVCVQQLREAYDAGVHALGESYWQEAKAHQAALSDLAIEWHFIGRLQTNKCGAIAQHFAWVHSLAHWHHAEALAEARHGLVPLNVCIQVSCDKRKEGMAPPAVAAFIERLSTLPSLQVRGLMVIPAIGDIEAFNTLAACFAELKQTLGLASYFDTLSMGMSADYPAALRAGATLIRLGTCLFKGNV